MSILTTEDGLIARIKAATTPGGTPKVKDVDSLDGAWDEATLKRVLRLVPAVFVFWAGGQPNTASSHSATMDADWIVYVVTSNASGAAARRRGDGKAVGAYELIDVLVPQLHGHTIPGIGTFKFAGVECLYNGTVEKQGVCVYAISLKLPTGFAAAGDPATLDAFETMEVKWDIPGFTQSQHRPWLQGDESVATPDAKDTIKPPQS